MDKVRKILVSLPVPPASSFCPASCFLPYQIRVNPRSSAASFLLRLRARIFSVSFKAEEIN
jgi:hypothetical protein